MANVNISNLLPYIGGILSTGGIIFQIGKQSEKLDSLGYEVKALENKEETYNIFMNNINGKLLLADEKLKNIEEDVKEIKSKMN